MTTYWVSPTGNDSNGGTQAQPFQTIQHAAGVVVAGDTVNVLPGVYTAASGTPVVTSNANGTSSARIKFVSTVPWGAKIRAIGSAWECCQQQLGEVRLPLSCQRSVLFRRVDCLDDVSTKEEQ